MPGVDVANSGSRGKGETGVLVTGEERAGGSKGRCSGRRRFGGLTTKTSDSGGDAGPGHGCVEGAKVESKVLVMKESRDCI